MKASPMASQALIALEHVGHEFDAGRIVALRDINLNFGRGESVAIGGASGSGKTTLILVMCGIRIPTKGILRWKGEPVTTLRQWTDLRRSAIGIVFQDFNLFPTLTASENVEVAMFGSGASSSERRRQVEEALETVGLTDRATHLPHEMSGGERQRVAIARALVAQPSCVLADEPTGNLDRSTAHTVFELMLQLAREDGTAFVVVTHDMQLADRCGERLQLGD